MGNRILITATQGGFADFSPGFPFTGNAVLAVLDLSDPANPTVLDTQTLARSAAGIGSSAALGNGLYAFGSPGIGSDKPGLFLVDVDASHPGNLVVTSIDVPAPITNITADGNLIFAVDRSSLIIYRVLASPGLPVTARVEIPRNTGVAVVPGSFNVAPTSILPGTGFDTYVFDLALTPSNPSQTLTWQSTVSAMQPGESRPVVLGATVDFTSQGTAGQVALPPASVASAQILALDPATQAVRPGAEASYTVVVSNPTGAAVTYALAIQ